MEKLAFGITPAGAGKTLKFFAALHRAWDHPRRCGENTDRGFVKGSVSGSPPQVRGKLGANIVLRRTIGITPAGAGKTELWIKQKLPAEDHPRRCGENPAHNNIFYRNQGSPPQVRGKQR